uniref:Tripartite motif containing 25, like n=1 Tax=Sinocyclocheilus anshuiensis TaxID=1608454 RepID=A0A671K5Z5_9TELE
MKKVLDTLTRSSETVRDEADVVLSELQESVQRMLELLQDVMVSTAQEKLNETQDVVTKLEAEVKQLKKKDGELKDLINCQDSIYFLKTYQSLCCPLEGGDLGAVTANPEATFDPVRSVIVQLREKVEELCDQELDKINKTVYNTTAFTVADRNGQKTGGIMKMFSGKGARATRAQGPPPLPSVSTRGSVNRGVTNSQRPARSRREERDDNEKSHSSLRPRETQRREERENNDVRSRGRPRGEDRDQVVMDRENQSSTQSRSTRDEEQADRWSLSSIRPRLRREDREQVNGETQQRSHAVDRQQPARQCE